MRLKDRVCIITGGGRGLGRDMALAFSREGAHIVVSGTTESAINSTAAEIRANGHQAIAIKCDVSDEAAIESMVATSLNEFGNIDVLVNNAGIIGPTANVTEIKREDWDQTIAVNLTGAFLCAKAVLPLMAERRQGKIINIASVAGHKGYPLRSPYSVSKWGMIGLSQTLAAEWGRFNIQVNTISPGPVRGDRMDEVIRRRAAQSDRPIEDVTRDYTLRLALERFVEPDHVAATAVFLASSESDSITGEVIMVSSGFGLS
ncbi:MAG: SDR family oxidoreductase [Acidobacteria bacterium]|nr:SDR family oxidoreductase [Acidobacteriota bacterium]